MLSEENDVRHWKKNEESHQIKIDNLYIFWNESAIYEVLQKVYKPDFSFICSLSHYDCFFLQKSFFKKKTLAIRSNMELRPQKKKEH